MVSTTTTYSATAAAEPACSSGFAPAPRERSLIALRHTVSTSMARTLGLASLTTMALALWAAVLDAGALAVTATVVTLVLTVALRDSYDIRAAYERDTGLSADKELALLGRPILAVRRRPLLPGLVRCPEQRPVEWYWWPLLAATHLTLALVVAVLMVAA